MWQGIFGHDAVVEQFSRTLAAGRLATTYLFLGPEGVGKRTFALKLAQALLCTSNDDASLEPCGRCESCRLAAAGNHPDIDFVGLLPNKRQLAIRQFVGEDDTRNREGLCYNLGLRPMSGRRRVAIIDDADWLTPESANCLLKTLEEPPPGAVIILLGTSRSRQLPTILSRAQIVRFDRLADATVMDLALRDGLAPDDASARLLAARSGGSVARARQLADSELWQMRDRFVAQWRSARLSVPNFARDVETFVAGAGKESDARRQRFRELLWLVNDFFRESLSMAPAESDAALAALERSIDAEEQLDRNANQSTLIESWLDDLAAIHESPSTV
jgi:DNA polymerase-3 subunit delta'